MSTALDTALAYAAHGWPVIPVNGTRPAVVDWQAAASTKPAVLRGWWASLPNANVGVLTGPRSGLIVLDVDPHKGGTESLGQLERRAGVLPGTVLNLTGDDHVQLLYSWPADTEPTVSQLGPGLDVHADCSFVVVPPSVDHASGKTYQWFGDVWEVPLPPWPVALGSAPRKQSVVVQALPTQIEAGPRVGPRLSALMQTVLDARHHERDRRLVWAASKAAELAAAGMAVDEVGDALLRAALQAGMSRPDAVKAIRTGLRRRQVAA